MEHGSFSDHSKSTFSLSDEDHTLANSIRFTLNQEFAHVSGEAFIQLPSKRIVTLSCSPRVTFCGYSIPHPSDARVNIRVQTTGDSAREVLKDACQDLMLMCQHVRSTFEKAVVDHKMSKPVKDMSIKK